MNQYAEHNPKCYECEQCEDYPGGRMATCMTARDAVQECTGVVASEVKFDPDHDAGHCPDFDPTQECLNRIAEDALQEEVKRGLYRGTDFPASLRWCG
jgi:hypothetical protein